MSNNCNRTIKVVKISELASYSSLKSDDIIPIVENNTYLYSKKTTFSDFVNSIVQLTSSLSGNVKGQFTGSLKGDVVGNITGQVKGNFIGGTIFNSTGSIKGIPFTTLNGRNISFEGTASYSVSSSYSPISDYSNNTLSSSYSLSSSIAYTDYIEDSISSSFSLTSSFSNNSLYTLSTSYAENSNLSNISRYASGGEKTDSSSYSQFSFFAVTSSYSNFSENSLTSSYSNTNTCITSSYSTISDYSLNSFAVDFDIIFFNSLEEKGNSDLAFSDNFILFNKVGTKGNWSKVILSGSYELPRFSGSVINPGTNQEKYIQSGSFYANCNANRGKLPANIEYLYLNVYQDNAENTETFPLLMYTPDKDDVSQPQLYIDLNKNRALGGDTLFGYTQNVIVPVKPQPSGSNHYFYVKILGTRFNYVEIRFLGYFKPRTCI